MSVFLFPLQKVLPFIWVCFKCFTPEFRILETEWQNHSLDHLCKSQSWHVRRRPSSYLSRRIVLFLTGFISSSLYLFLYAYSDTFQRIPFKALSVWILGVFKNIWLCFKRGLKQRPCGRGNHGLFYNRSSSNQRDVNFMAYPTYVPKNKNDRTFSPPAQCAEA